MIVTYYRRDSGEIVQINDVWEEAEIVLNQPEGCGVVLGEFHWTTHRVDPATHEAIPRPVVPVMTGPRYDLGRLPQGSALIVTDEVGVSTGIPAQEDILILTDPGAYAVRSQSPFPWIDFDTKVIVDAN